MGRGWLRGTGTDTSRHKVIMTPTRIGISRDSSEARGWERGYVFASYRPSEGKKKERERERGKGGRERESDKRIMKKSTKRIKEKRRRGEKFLERKPT